MRSDVVRHVHVAIAGSGFGGLGTAIRLKESGENDFLVFEREGRVGGVWRDNTYPGCACDVPSHLYSFSFAKNPDWTRSYSPSAEIQAYLEGCAERFGVVPHLRFHHTVTSASWDDQAQRWRLETTGGLYTADTFVAAVGGLSEPRMPDIPGIADFTGKVFPRRAGTHTYTLRGKNVAVVGTGASAIQFVPRIQPEVKTLTLFQRTPPWIVPRGDQPIRRAHTSAPPLLPRAEALLRGTIYSTREIAALMFMHRPVARFFQKLAVGHLARSVADPLLRDKLTPSFVFGCKRILISDDYYPAVQAPQRRHRHRRHREDRASRSSSRRTAARSTPSTLDHLSRCTGFQIQDYPFGRHIFGRGGQNLAERWRTTMTAHLGTTCVGFPNLFMLQGPNTCARPHVGHLLRTMIEAQIEHILNALKYMKKTGATSVEPRPEAQAAFVEDVDTRMRGTVWTAGGCKSWYLDPQGRNSTLWPGFTFSFRRRVAPFLPDEYVATQGDPVLSEGAGSALAYNLGRAMMSLPPSVQVGLSGGSPIRVDGHALDPGLQFLISLDRHMGGAWPADPAAFRRKHNRDAVVISGPKTPVHFTRDFSIPASPVRSGSATTRPRLLLPPLLIFFHGGGYVFGDLETHDAGCRLLCRHGGMHVLAVDYRLAPPPPEHPFSGSDPRWPGSAEWAATHCVILGADH